MRPAPAAAVDPDQKYADLKTCALESGETIHDCRIGYRTFGTLDATRSNVVLFPTWFSGTTKPLVEIVPDKLVDTKSFFLVLVDALGDGVSTCPSNSRTQPRLSFPRFTIRDMVASQRRLLTEVLGDRRISAPSWASRWAACRRSSGASRTPTSSIGSCRSSERRSSRRTICCSGRPSSTRSRTTSPSRTGATRGGRSSEPSRSPRARADDARVSRVADEPRGLPGVGLEQEAGTGFDWNDWHRQLEAMLVHDVAKPYGGSLEAAAKRVKAKALFVVADQDHMVSPIPARAFASAMGEKAKVVSLDGPCGHIAPTCEAPKLEAAVTAYLSDFGSESVHVARERRRLVEPGELLAADAQRRAEHDRAEQASDEPVPRLDRSYARAAIAERLEHEAMLGPHEASHAAAPCDLVGRRACSTRSVLATGAPATFTLMRSPSRSGEGVPGRTTSANERGIHVGHEATSARRSNTRCGGASMCARLRQRRTCSERRMTRARARVRRAGEPGPVFAFAQTCARVGPHENVLRRLTCQMR